MDLVPCEPFRQRFAVMHARGELNLTRVADLMNYRRRRSSIHPTISSDTTRARKLLAKEYLAYEEAVKLADVLVVDPVEVGI